MNGAESVPDWAALYLKNRDAMFRVASSVLRPYGLADRAADAVQEAMVSLINSPPRSVRNWEAVMVVTAKRRALDIVGSASVRHDGPPPDGTTDRLDELNVAEDVADAIDRKRLAAQVFDNLALLDDRQRTVIWEVIALERPRAQVAKELGVTPGRISQIQRAALKVLSDAMPREEVNE